MKGIYLNMSTPEYTKKAIAAYNAKFDRVQVNLPKGTKDLIKEKYNISCNKYINKLIQENLYTEFPCENNLPFD